MSAAIKEHKAVAVELKGDSSGEFEVRFATKKRPDGELVIDHDGDVYADGAVSTQPITVGCYNHGTCEGPAGIGATFETDTDIRAKGRLFMDTRAGRDEYARWKALGPQAEFSYIFQVLDHDFVQISGRRVRRLKSLAVISVDLVARGAGIDTGVLALKGGCGCGDDAPDLTMTIAEAKATLEKLDRMDAGRAIRDVQKTLRDMERVEVPAREVDSHARTVVMNALCHAKSFLQAAEPRVRWFRTGPTGDPAIWGEAVAGSGEIWLKDGLPDDVEIYRVTCHEASHEQGFNEYHATEFGDMMAELNLARRAHRKAYDDAIHFPEPIQRVRWESWDPAEVGRYIEFLGRETADLRRHARKELKPVAFR